MNGQKPYLALAAGHGDIDETTSVDLSLIRAKLPLEHALKVVDGCRDVVVDGVEVRGRYMGIFPKRAGAATHRPFGFFFFS